MKSELLKKLESVPVDTREGTEEGNKAREEAEEIIKKVRE